MRRVILFIALSTLVMACPPPEQFKSQMKRGLYDYLQNPDASSLTLYELKDLIVLFLTEDISTINCNDYIGTESGIPMDYVIQKTANIVTKVPTCSDGTEYGECSSKRPRFCYSGYLKQMCSGPDKIYGNADDCGCPDYEACETDGTCRAMNISCFSDNDCGTSTALGSAYCDNKKIVQDEIVFTCSNPGTELSSCSYANQTVTLQHCSGNCYEGACI